MEEKSKRKSGNKPDNKQTDQVSDSSVVWCTVYTNRWGKVMKASDYGYKAWRFSR